MPSGYRRGQETPTERGLAVANYSSKLFNELRELTAYSYDSYLESTNYGGGYAKRCKNTNASISRLVSKVSI